jgi:hypothetical protein
MSISGGKHARVARPFTYGATVAACTLTALLAGAPVTGATGAREMRMTGSHAMRIGSHAMRLNTG